MFQKPIDCEHQQINGRGENETDLEVVQVADEMALNAEPVLDQPDVDEERTEKREEQNEIDLEIV